MIISGRILHTALQNRMNKTENSFQKSIQRMSSGKRINSAADDAAGLSISQRMKALIRGSQQAGRNVQDASSLVQTADGAMEEMSGILQRMRELTIQAGNDTNTQKDRLSIQDEIDQLNKELNSIVVNTEFNQKKILSNLTPEYIYEDRFTSKTSQLTEVSRTQGIQEQGNRVWSSSLQPEPITTKTGSQLSPSVTEETFEPIVINGSTVVDHLPKWTMDGNSILFMSSRDGNQYRIPVDGSSDPTLDSSGLFATQRMMTENSLMKLYSGGSTLYLQARSTINHSWSTIATYNYNANDGGNGYSFSPKVDAAGNTSFVFSDNEGNIRRVDVNSHSQTILSAEPIHIIPSTDTVNLSEINHSIELTSAPQLYKMNTDQAAFKVYKVNDHGSRELTFWDGQGETPSEGYFTVEGKVITFHGDARIGGEDVDDAQDFYTFSFVSNGSQDGVFTVSIPNQADVYNMNGEEGPRSLDILIGGRSVTKEQLLQERPIDAAGVTGVYVDGQNGKIEFYGDLRPTYDEKIAVRYRSDSDGRNEVYTVKISSHIDTYNLMDPDLSKNRPLRVFVTDANGAERELTYDEENGFTYNSSNGELSLHGLARPDIPSNTAIRVEYVADTTGNAKDVFGISLGSRYPEVYNLGSETSPSSIRVYRNGEEIPFSDSDGFQYNQTNNRIELFGTARPDTNDTYSVHMIGSTVSSRYDGVVELGLYYRPETYVEDESADPMTFRVLVDGTEIEYDSTKTEGFVYNPTTNRIEIYGDARPDAGHQGQRDVQVFYVYESAANLIGNNTYDFRLSSQTLDYGIEDEEGPKAIRVYQHGVEVPYGDEDGFTYDPSTNIVSLHGQYRPTKNTSTSTYQVYSISESAIKEVVPPNAYIYKVELNGEEISEASSPDGNGYYHHGQSVELIGNARPDIKNTSEPISLKVSYYDSLDILLDNSPFVESDPFQGCEEGTQHLYSEIDPEMSVFLNGTLLSNEQYSLHGNRVELNKEKVDVSLGENLIEVDYRVRHVVGYEESPFTFQVGANQGQSFQIAIDSFHNLLMDTNKVCVRSSEKANQSIAVLDKALDFVVGERGKMGAVQNRLESIASNLAVLEENTTASLSRIQDADMAKEAMELVKSQLLSQSQIHISSHLRQSQHQVLSLLE